MLAAPKSKGVGAAADKAKPAGDAEGSEKEFFRVAAQALADGDVDGAADALESAVKACIAKGEAGEYEPDPAAE